MNSTSERFKQIKTEAGKETIYAISNKGRVLNTKRNKFIKPNPKSRRKNHALEDIEPNNMYMEYALYIDGKYHYKLAHRLVAEYFIPIPEKYTKEGLTADDLVVDHKDDVRYHNYEENLQWLTTAENHDKMMNKGRNRIAYGSKHGLCKYTEEQLNLVGLLFEENILTKKEIADVTGVHYKAICSISTGKKFAYLHELYDFSKYDRKTRNDYSEDDIRLGFILLSDMTFTMKKISQITRINYSVLKDMLHGRTHKDIAKEYDLSKRLKIDND